MDTTEATTQTTTPENKTITLSDGRIVTIFQGKGYHSRKALQESNGDGFLYLSIFMSMLIEIDGKKVIPEELDELTSKDYTLIQSNFSDINF